MKSIMQDEDRNMCYLCMLLKNDYTIKYTEEHHCIHGTSGRAKAEKLGLKVRLCLAHHREGKEAVHNGNISNDLILKMKAQAEYELTHTRKEFVKEVGRSWL